MTLVRTHSRAATSTAATSATTTTTTELALAPGARLASAVRVVHHLREALRHLALAHEEDRARLHRELHEGIEPALAVLAQGLDSLAHERWATDPLLGNQLEEMAVEAEHLLAELRRVAAELPAGSRPRWHLRGHAALPARTSMDA